MNTFSGEINRYLKFFSLHPGLNPPWHPKTCNPDPGDVFNVAWLVSGFLRHSTMVLWNYGTIGLILMTFSMLPRLVSGFLDSSAMRRRDHFDLLSTFCRKFGHFLVYSFQTLIHLHTKMDKYEVYENHGIGKTSSMSFV